MHVVCIMDINSVMNVIGVLSVLSEFLVLVVPWWTLLMLNIRVINVTIV